MTTGWDFFDRIYCISLAERADRRAEATAQFARVGLAERVQFVVVDKDPAGAEKGCYESHLQCLRLGLAAGAERILIFEDDIVFSRFSHGLLQQAADFCSRHPRWHVLFFGCMVRGSRRTAYPAIRQVQYRSLTHAYAVPRNFAQALVQHPWSDVAYDDFLRDLHDREMYALCPSFAFQSNSPSDNERYLPLDRFRRLCGGLQRLQELDEFYHRRRTLVIGVHLLLVVLLLRALA
ncbi:MAG: hypothetical protein BWK76_09525 [Desulfobulbaceae bacterium A2]|nr:MAG: hypothetical protein BWK76_09525 [Desulfobulbaceae bacterium A2]